MSITYDNQRGEEEESIVKLSKMTCYINVLLLLKGLRASCTFKEFYHTPAYNKSVILSLTEPYSKTPIIESHFYFTQYFCFDK